MIVRGKKNSLQPRVSNQFTHGDVNSLSNLRIPEFVAHEFCALAISLIRAQRASKLLRVSGVRVRPSGSFLPQDGALFTTRTPTRTHAYICYIDMRVCGGSTWACVCAVAMTTAAQPSGGPHTLVHITYTHPHKHIHVLHRHV